MQWEHLKQLARTVSFRIALWHAVTFIVGSILVFGAAYFLLLRSMDEQTQDEILFRLNRYAADYDRGGKDGLLEVLNLRKGRAQRAFFVRLSTPDDTTLFLRDAEDWAEFSPGKLAGRPLSSKPEWMDLYGGEGTILRLAMVRLPDGNGLQVGTTLVPREALLERFGKTQVLIAGIVILMGALGGASVAFRALRPVRQLTESVRSILVTGHFKARVQARGTGDEIDELVKYFNQMSEKIELLLSSMRDSLDNVAHDLRTPMTRLRNRASSAIEEDYDKKESHEALSDCLEESERVMTMLRTLMDIAEAETGAMRLNIAPIQVGLLISQAIDLYQHVADEKRIEVETSINAGLDTSGDAGRLLRTVCNLVDNALKYTPEGGRVRIHAFAKDGMIHIEIEDNGEGMPEEELERIWERLYRLDKSRTQRGLGLGLSFVKAIVEAHRGWVRVESTQGAGSRFTIAIPG